MATDLATDADGAKALGAEIGLLVRHFRKKAGLSGVKLAAAAGISQPFLSQLESGQTSVAIATLYRIARALRVHPGDLLPVPGPGMVEVLRAEESRGIASTEQVGVAKALVSSRAGARITGLWDHTVEATDHLPDWVSANGEHALYVLDGTLTLAFKGHSDVVLAPGDAAFYSGRMPHRWHATEAARCILVVVDA